LKQPYKIPDDTCMECRGAECEHCDETGIDPYYLEIYADGE
jgi:hypothetical protein